MDEALETDLIHRAQQGDARAFGALAMRYEKVLFNLALRMVRNREDARDLTQTVFLKAYRGIGRFDTNRRLFSWLYRIMLNESLNHLGSRRTQEPLDEDFESPGGSPEDTYEVKRLDAIVQSGLMELNTEHRQVIVLRHFMQLSYEEIASVLEIPAKTVKSRLFGARHQLAPILRRLGVNPS
jgi:RNA polymerase sigma-70 factor (ECF subfamily)